MRALIAAAPCVALWACAAPAPVAPAPTPPPLVCPAGQHADGARCAWDLPPADCAPHTHARVGESACQPIGAGPCAAPIMVEDGAWGCRARAPDHCEAPTAPLLGEDGCAVVGWSSCPEGFVVEGRGCRPTWARACRGPSRVAIGLEDCAPVGDCRRALPAADLWVDAAYTADQVDATHFTTVGAAVAAARSGAVIVVAAGRYAEAIDVGRSLTLAGACTERTRIDGGLTVVTRGVEVVLSNLTLSGDRAGLVVGNGARVRGDALAIEGTVGAGARVQGAASALELVDVVIRDVRSSAAGDQGRGVSVEGGALRLSRATLERTREAAVIAVGSGARAELEAVVIVDALPSANGDGGHGLAAASRGLVEAHAVAIAGTHDVGALAYLSGSVVRADALWIERTGLGGTGAGARADSGGRLVLSGLSIVDAAAVGVMADDAASTASVSAAWIARVRPDGSTGFSAGVALFAGARADATALAVEEASVGAAVVDGAALSLSRAYVAGRAASVGVLAEAARATLEAVTLDRHPAGGVVAQRGADVVLDRALVLGGESSDGPSTAVYADASTVSLGRSAIVGGLGFGLLATGTAAVARVSGSLVRGQRSSDTVVGQGVALDGGRLEMDGSRVEAVDGLGLLSVGRAALSRTTLVGITASRRINGAALALGGTSVLRDVAVVGCQLAGVVFGAGRSDVDGLLVRDTAPNDDDQFGHALLGEGATVLASHLELRASAAAGLAMDASTARIVRSLLVRNVVGAHAQGGSTLVERAEPEPEPPALEVVLGEDVLLLDNATRVGVGTIPLPDPFGAR